MKKTIIAVILCLGLLVVFGAAAVGGEPAETGKKGAAVSYAYVSFAELWNGEPSTEALRAIRGILTDTCAGMEAGERMPVGYLYQGQAVYTIVEQPDGSLKLTNYELQPVDSAGGLGETIIPDYQVVSTEQRPAEPHEVALLYP